MNIALIIEAFGTLGGAERMAGYVADGLLKRGHEVHVYAGRFDGAAGVVEHRVTAKGLNRHVAFARGVRKSMRKHDVVYSFTRTVTQDILRLGGGIHAEYLKRMEAARSVVGRLFSRINPKERAILKLEREGLETTARIIAVSHRVKREAVEHYGIDAKKIQVMHNGVDLKRFSMRRDRGWLNANGIPDGFTVLFVGSGFRRKGLKIAIDAVSRVPGAQMVVCGKDKPMPAPRVHFVGAVREIEKAYAAADALVLPALYDPFPNVCLEAMASGVPVVVSDVCGPSEIITHGTDSFVANDAAAIAECLVAIRANPALGRAARATAEKHSIDDYLSRTLDLFTRP